MSDHQRAEASPGIAIAGEGSLARTRPPLRPLVAAKVAQVKPLFAPGQVPEDLHEPDLWRGRWILYLLGTGMIAWGLRGLYLNTSHKALLHTIRFMVVGIIAHDGIVAPSVFVLGLVAVRVLPQPAKLPVQVGLLVGGVLTILAIPVIRSPRRTDNSSINPLPYERNLAILLGCVAVGVLSAIAIRMWLDHHPRSGAVANSSTPATNPIVGE